MKSRTNLLVIQTPEGISFPLFLASPVTRFLAWVIDFFCIAVLSKISGLFMGFLGWISWDIAQATGILLYFVFSIGYGVIMEWYWKGQTIGKRLLRLRVVDGQGFNLHFSQIVIRNLLRFIDSLPGFYFVGGVVCLLSPRTQRLGDIAANTLVVRHPQVAQPDFEKIFGNKYNSFREYPHLAGRLRQRVSVQEAGILLEALLRRDDLEPSARLALFREMVDYLEKKISFPSEVKEGIADEQYVRNVTDILFRTDVKKAASNHEPETTLTGC